MKRKKEGVNLLYVLVLVFLAWLAFSVSDPTVTGFQVSPFRATVEFMRAFGFFEVVLPFLLVFAIVYGILEKTKIFGEEKIKGEPVPRRNLNAIVAFAIALFVVGASNVVNIIQASIPTVGLFLVIIVAFLILIGAFVGEEQLKMVEKFPYLSKVFIALIFIGMIGLFLSAVGLLNPLFSFLGKSLSPTMISTIIFLIVIIGVVWVVVKGAKPPAAPAGGK